VLPERGAPTNDVENESKPAKSRGKDERPDALMPFSVRLRSDQIAFLKGLPNASLWLRKIIDDGRVREPATATRNRVLLLTRQLKDIEEQTKSMKENTMYLEAKDNLTRIREQKNPLDSTIEFYQKLMSRAYEGVEKRVDHLPHSIGEHLDYLDPPDPELMEFWRAIKNLHEILSHHLILVSAKPAHIIQTARSEASTLLPELHKLQDSLGREETKYETIVAGFDAEIKTLAEKHEGLEEELLREGHAAGQAESGRDGVSGSA
jgi:hypothetical protein